MVSHHKLSCLILILSLATFVHPAVEAGKKSDGETLPHGAIAQLRNKDSGSRGATYGLAFAPHFRWLMVSGNSPEVHLLDRVSGKIRKSFSVGERGSVGGAALSQDGRLLAVHVQTGPTPARIHVFEIESGRERWRRGADELNVHELRFSPDGKTLAVAGLQAVRFWDASTGKEKRQFKTDNKESRLGGEEDVLRIAYSPDGKLLAAGTRGGRIHVWNVGSGKSVRVLGPARGSGTPFAVCSLCFSPAGDMLACGQNSRVLIWDTLLWTEIVQLSQHDGGVFSVGFAPDGRTLATGCWDAQVRLWEIATWKKYAQFRGHTGQVWHSKFSPHGRVLVSGGQDGKVYLWDVFGLAKERKPRQLSAPKLEELWKMLHSDDPVRAYQAVCALAAAPKQAVPLMKERLQPATVGSVQVEQLLADLNADNFSVREKATAALAKLGKSAQPALRRLQGNPPSEEVRRRVGSLLAKLQKEPPPADFLLAVRATAILELVGSAQSREVLQTLTKGAPGAPLTEQAKSTLSRLARETDP